MKDKGGFLIFRHCVLSYLARLLGKWREIHHATLLGGPAEYNGYAEIST